MEHIYINTYILAKQQALGSRCTDGQYIPRIVFVTVCYAFSCSASYPQRSIQQFVCGTRMSSKCIKISSCFCFFIFSVGLFLIALLYPPYTGSYYDVLRKRPVVTFSDPEHQCYSLCRLKELLPTWPYKTPSLEWFIRESSTEENQVLRGLAVYSNLTNACQPPVDVNKSKILLRKIALITNANHTVCPLAKLVENAQNAGYSVVILVLDFVPMQTDINLLIPVLSADYCVWKSRKRNMTPPEVSNVSDPFLDFFIDVDGSSAEIIVSQTTISKMEKYLERLYYWFLLGPLITLEWLRRTNKFFCMSRGQQVNEEHGTEDEEGVGETSLHSVVSETQKNYNQEVEDEQTAGEKQPLLIVTSDPHSNLTNNEHTRPTTIRRVKTLFAKIFGKFAVDCGYVILIIAALPVGLSSGGWSFFRFDENEDVDVKSFWDPVFNDTSNITDKVIITYGPLDDLLPEQLLKQFLALWWSPLQILCFFL